MPAASKLLNFLVEFPLVCCVFRVVCALFVCHISHCAGVQGSCLLLSDNPAVYWKQRIKVHVFVPIAVVVLELQFIFFQIASFPVQQLACNFGTCEVNLIELSAHTLFGYVLSAICSKCYTLTAINSLQTSLFSGETRAASAILSSARLMCFPTLLWH